MNLDNGYWRLDNACNIESVEDICLKVAISIPPNSQSSQFPFLPIPVPPNHPLNSLSLPVVSGSQGLGQGQWSLCEYGF